MGSLFCTVGGYFGAATLPFLQKNEGAVPQPKNSETGT
jgi:hypothetical protein